MCCKDGTHGVVDRTESPSAHVLYTGSAEGEAANLFLRFKDSVGPWHIKLGAKILRCYIFSST